MLEWLEQLSDKINDDKLFVKTRPEMLMGMLNAGSTTLGMLPANYKMDKMHMKVVGMRSSDVSMTKYRSDTTENNIKCISKNKHNLSLIGINLSPDKTFFFIEGFGKYTSWYTWRGFVSQFGTEIPSIHLQGKNPGDDLYFNARSTSVDEQENDDFNNAIEVLRHGFDSIDREKLDNMDALDLF